MEIDYINTRSKIAIQWGGLHPERFIRFYNLVVDRVKPIEVELNKSLKYHITVIASWKVGCPNFVVSTARVESEELRNRLQNILNEVMVIVLKEDC